MARPRRTASGQVKASQENTSETATDITTFDVNQLTDDIANKFFEMLDVEPSTEPVEPPKLSSLEQSIVKTLGFDESSVNVYNPTTRFLIPEVAGIVRLDQSQLSKVAAKSTSVFLRAGILSSTVGDNTEKLDKDIDLVADLIGQADGDYKLKNMVKKRETAGKKWFDLPATELTDELKNDFRLIRNRTALYRDHFYKREKGNLFPKYFQVGTIVEGVTDVLSKGRINKKDRKNTMLAEVLAEKDTTNYLKKRFKEVQAAAPKKRKFTGKHDYSKKARK